MKEGGRYWYVLYRVSTGRYTLNPPPFSSLDLLQNKAERPTTPNCYLSECHVHDTFLLGGVVRSATATRKGTSAKGALYMYKTALSYANNEKFSHLFVTTSTHFEVVAVCGSSKGVPYTLVPTATAENIRYILQVFVILIKLIFVVKLL
jgi:hypothetical protein